MLRFDVVANILKFQNKFFPICVFLTKIIDVRFKSLFFVVFIFIFYYFLNEKEHLKRKRLKNHHKILSNIYVMLIF